MNGGLVEHAKSAASRMATARKKLVIVFQCCKKMLIIVKIN